MEKLKTNPAAAAGLPKKLAAGVFSALIGFLLAGIRFEGAASPFAAAFTAGAAQAFVLPAALGSAAGALLFHDALTALKYIGAVTLIFIFRTAYDRFVRPGRELWLFPLAAFGSVGLCSAVIVLAEGTAAWTDLVVLLCEALIAGAGACFSLRMFALFPGGLRTLGGSPADTAVMLLSGSVLLLSLARFSVGVFSPAHLIGCFCVLLVSFTSGEAAGGAAGICAGLVLGYSAENSVLAYFLPAAGLLCGVLSGYGRLLSAGVFSALAAMFIVLKGSGDTAFPLMIEAAAAALLFSILPKKAVSAVGARLRPFSREKYAAETKTVLRLRLRREAKAVRDISDSVKAVCRMLSAPQAVSPADTFSLVRQNVCESCVKRDVCWSVYARRTAADFERLLETLLRNGNLTPEDVPNSLRSVCRSQNAVLASMQQALCEQNARLRAQNEIYDVKALAAAQFGSVAALLEEAARSAGEIGETDPYLAALARDVFTSFGFTFSSLSLSADENGRMLLEVFCTRIPRMTDDTPLLEKLREKTNIAFMPPVQDEYKKEGTVLCFCEKTALRAQYYKVSAPALGENLCGDTAEAFPDGRGNFYCVLSDGMGTGKEAAIDSVMTCSLFSRLMRAGFSPENALGAVNCALMVKSEEESLATLDLLKLDLYGGKAEFFKAGSSFSVVRRGSKTAVVEQSSLPLGILRETKFQHSEITLQAGDAVLMLSDGAGNISREYFKDLFYRNRDADAKDLAETVLAEALRRAPIGRADDITVACVRLVE